MHKARTRLAIIGTLLTATALIGPTMVSAADDNRPNIVLLVADDAGYSDFARFGGETQTPAIDSLSDEGMTFTNFHAMPTCSPSRSVFLTGVDNHINGLGTMQGQLHAPGNVQVGLPGYTGYANDRVVLISELMQDSGYHTYMVGKWHLGEEDTTVEGGQTIFPQATWPISRGFEHSYGMLNGGGDHYGSCERVEGTCTRFFEDAEILIPTDDFSADYFSATAHTNKAIEYIDAGKDEDSSASGRKPFFLYYADTMPHEPLQLPAEYIKQEYIDMYYKKGWDGIRADRLERLKALGIMPQNLPLPARNQGYPDWHDENDPNWDVFVEAVTATPAVWGNISTVDEIKLILAKGMAIYAGMVEFFDAETDRLIAHLQEIGEYDNTVFIFFSDNGGDPREWDVADINTMIHRGTDNSYANIGNAGSFISNGREWAQAINTPLYGSKITNAEGGLRVPMVAAFPGGDIQASSRSDALTTVADVADTVLDYANIAHPVGAGARPDWDNCTGTYGDLTDVCPMNGKSMRDLFTGTKTSLHNREPIGYELFGAAARNANTGEFLGELPNKAMFYEVDGKVWKILRLGFAIWGHGMNEPWKLYELTSDPSEANDLAEVAPHKLAYMMSLYNNYEQSAGVVPQNAKKKTDVAPGSSVDYSFTLKNTDDVPETYTISCHSDWECQLSRQGKVTLAAGASLNISATVDVPADANGMTRTTQVRVIRKNNLAMSNNQIFVTQVAE